MFEAGLKNRVTDGWTGGWMGGWTDGRMDGWTDGRTDGRKDGRTDGRSNGPSKPLVELLFATKKMENKKNNNFVTITFILFF